MENSEKIQLSANFIFTKLVCVFFVGLSFLFAFGSSNNAVDSDFKTALEYKLFFFVAIIGAAYFFTRPKVCHDNTNLYIKRIIGKEVTVSFKKIDSIFRNPFLIRSHITWYSIEYSEDSGENSLIKFAVDYPLDKINNFISLVKEMHPKVDISI